MKFEVSGYNLDGLLKTLYLKKIPIKNLSFNSKTEISFESGEAYLKKINRYISNYKVKQKLSFFRRLPKLLFVNLGLVLAIFIGSIAYIFASAYTWQIRIYGLKDLSEDEILSVLAQNNVKIGKINHQSSEQIEEILLSHYDRIAQVSVIRVGTAIMINLSEKLVYIEGEYKPITARYSGIVSDVNIITGTPNVKVGDYVNAGDVLVLPFNISSSGDQVSVNPIAEISGTIYVIGRCEISKTETILTESGRVINEYHYKLKNLNLFSGKNKNSFAKFYITSYNENVSDLIPLARVRLKYHELVETQISRDFALEHDNLAQKSRDHAYSNLPVTDKILSEDTVVNVEGDKMYACTTITVQGLISG